MFINTLSHFLLDLLAPDLEKLLKSVFNSSIAVSPVMEQDSKPSYENLLFQINMKSEKSAFKIYLLENGLEPEKKAEILNNFKNKLYKIKVALNIFFKSDFKIEISESTDSSIIPNKTGRIDISINIRDQNIYISMLLPVEFFRLFSSKVTDIDSDVIEKEIIDYFFNPLNLFPDLKILLKTLNETEIQRLLYHLQKKKLLTPYQISLMLLSFPHHNILIRNNLSSNVTKEVNSILKDLNINKRDIIGGIYSIEEAVYSSMKSKEDFSYSSFISGVQESLKTYLNSQSIMKKGFIGWIEEMDSSNKLFYVLSLAREDDILKIVNDDPGYYYNLFLKYLPKKRMDEIFSALKNKNFSLSERLEAQHLFVSNYKKLKIKRMSMNHEVLPALLSRIDKNEMIYLLFRVGWFVLSTSLKNSNMKKVIHLIERLPLGAKYLIVDAVHGIVNPNIIHDNMQINKAKLVCVNEILSLYEDGIISL